MIVGEPTNKLRVQVYSSGTTAVYDPDDELSRAEQITLSTIYPGGLYAAATFYIGRDPTRDWYIIQGQRVAMFNGDTMVWEGVVLSHSNVWEEDRRGRTVSCIGKWGDLMMRRHWRKVWADNRLGDDTWLWKTDASAADRATIDRNSRIRMTPKAEEWAVDDYAAVEYTMPTGETVKRITYSYDFNEIALVAPKKVWHFNTPSPYTSLDNAIDDDTSTSVTLTITTGDYLYIDLLDETSYNLIRFDLGTVNANASVMTAEYTADDGSGGFSWDALVITDGTISSGKTLAQDGDITFTRPANMVKAAVNGVTKAWVRLEVSADLTSNMTIREIKVGQTQAWKLSLYNVGTAAEVATVTTSGGASVDHTLATPSQAVQLRLVSLAKQTPPSNGTVAAEWTGVTVYSETGSINLTEIAKDIRAKVTDLNSDETNIDSNTFSLVPFIADDNPTVADILAAAVADGDADYDSWAYGLLASEEATTPDGKPVLFVEQWPVLTDHDYVVYHEDENLLSPLDIEWTLDNTWNHITVVYTDADGRTQYLTPDDNANLKDTTSIASYGQREYVLRISGRYANSTRALNAGRRFLKEHKDRQFRINGLAVQGYIRAKNGNPVPACEIRAGKRVKIGDYVDDGSNTWQTHLITATNYDDTTQTCQIGVGKPDWFAIFQAREARRTA